MSGINIPVTVTGADTAATQLGKVSTSLGGIKNASNTAGQSLTNLGRIAQDAPFGFIGIQNNLNPLIESFGRLKAETGSTGGAFKALLAGLAGPAGIGVAVSVVTGALTILSQQGFFKTAEAADEAAKKAKEFQKSIDSIQSSVAAEQANILVLVKALESETTSREKKAAALKQLQQINPQYFGDLKLEGNLVEGLGVAYKNYSASILASVQNKIDTKRLEDVLTKLNEAQEQQQRNQLLIKSNEAEIARLTALGGKQYVGNLITLNQQLGATDKIVSYEKQRDEILQRIASRNSEGLIKFGKVAKDAKKTTKEIETIDSTIAKLRDKLDVLNKEEITFNVDKSKEKIKELEGTISTLFTKFKLTPEAPKIQELKDEINLINGQIIRDENARIITTISIGNVKDRKEEIAKEIEDGQKDLAGLIKPIKLPFKIEDPIGELGAKITEIGKNAAQAITELIPQAFIGIGEAIGTAIGEGTNIIAASFQSLIQLVGQGLKILGEAMIKVSLAKIALEQFKIVPGVGTLIAGIAAVAAGALLQTIKIPGFANGVTNFGGGMALVGERGPEIVRLPSGSDVIPNFRLNSMKASSPMAYIPNVTLRGSDLIIAMQRQAATNSRSGGGGNGWFFYGDSKPGK